MNFYQQWEENWPTQLGQWTPGESVSLHGKDLLNDFEHLSWHGLYLYAISKKTFSARQLELFEKIWSLSTSFPEPRLWNNRVGALSASSRSTMSLAMSAGTAVSEAVVYGQRPIAGAMSFLMTYLPKHQQGMSIRDIIEQRLQHTDKAGQPGRGSQRSVAKLPGFGRPITQQDERITPLLNWAKKAELDGPYTEFALAVEQYLIKSGNPLRMNIASLMASLCADQGLTQEEFKYYISLCFSIGIAACYVDALKKPEKCFFPLRCSRLHYDGPEERTW